LSEALFRPATSPATPPGARPEALAVAVLGVHAQQHLRPVLGLGAALSGVDVEEAVVRVHGVGEHAPEFQPLDQAADAGDVGLDAHERGVVTLGAGEREELARVAQPPIDLLHGSQGFLERPAFLAQLLRLLRVVPDPGSSSARTTSTSRDFFAS
jgi:hypothetical protein